jgi:hypothetical protein
VIDIQVGRSTLIVLELRLTYRQGFGNYVYSFRTGDFLEDHLPAGGFDLTETDTPGTVVLTLPLTCPVDEHIQVGNDPAAGGNTWYSPNYHTIAYVPDIVTPPPPVTRPRRWRESGPLLIPPQKSVSRETPQPRRNYRSSSNNWRGRP